MIDKNGLVLAGFNSVDLKYNGLVTWKFKNTNRYKDNKFVNLSTPILLCYGAEIIRYTLPKKHVRLHQKACERIFRVFNNFHKEGMPFFIDSGGFQICKGDVPPEYVDYLIEYYTKFIEETSNNDLYKDSFLYFYMDILPTNGITPDFATNKMLEFNQELNKRCSNCLDKIYLVMHCNAISSYDTFHKFIYNNSIHEQLNSHRYAVGGMVPLNFNQSSYIVRPYMVALFDVIDLELNNLKQGTSVYFHILGISAIYEMMCFVWLNIICEYYELPLIITFDSTGYLSLSSKAGVCHHIDIDDNIDNIDYITMFYSKYNMLKKNVYNRKYTNEYYLDKVREDITQELDLDEQDYSWFYTDGRWTDQCANALTVYESWAIGKIYEYIKYKSYAKKDWIINQDKRGNLKQLMMEILSVVNPLSIKSGGRLAFDTNICSRIIQSLNWFELSLNNKLSIHNKSYNLVKSMFSSNTSLITNTIKKIDLNSFKK